MDFITVLATVPYGPFFIIFLEYSEFELDSWNIYKAVNQKFADAILEKADEDDTIWVHDYQLMLVPQMVREQRPNISIGFFLHIPFPSYEIFRTFHGVKKYYMVFWVRFNRFPYLRL